MDEQENIPFYIKLYFHIVKALQNIFEFIVDRKCKNICTKIIVLFYLHI